MKLRESCDGIKIAMNSIARMPFAQAYCSELPEVASMMTHSMIAELISLINSWRKKLLEAATTTVRIMNRMA